MPLPVRAVLDNIRSLYNVGSIFRAAAAAGIEGLVLCGITAAPPHPSLRKTALGADQRVPFEHHRDAAAAVAGEFAAEVEPHGVVLIRVSR